MQHQPAKTHEVTEALARLYIDELARAEGVSTNMMLSLNGRDEIADIVGDMDTGPTDTEAPYLRVDLVLAAALCARMVAAEPGLARRLRQDSPVVAIQTHTAAMTLLVNDIVDKCVTRKISRRKIICRDGTDAKLHLPEKGNADVVQALSSRHLIVGIAPDPRRHLPRALMRTVEYQLAVPAVDEWTIRLVLEAITGKTFEGAIDPVALRQADVTDFSLAFRRDLTPEACLKRLSELLRTKRAFMGDGPALEDLDGYGEAKTWGLELAADLVEYRAGRLKWDDVDHKGLILSGPPGVGKTSFARALAKSADVPLISTSVAQWNANSYLSGTLQAIRDVFGEAKRSAPAVLFIDELDGISSRDRLRGDYVEYWSQIVNLLLECLAGIEDREGVVVVGATNHVDKIDPAILRAGRMDHHIELFKPDIRDLAKIFRHHIGQGALPGADLVEVALAARGGTGADVEAWVRRAKARARRQRRELSIDDLMLQIRGAAEHTDTEVRSRIAAHEAGHVVVARLLKTGELIGVSIVGRGGATEIAIKLQSTDNEAALDRTLAFLLAGRAAEIVTFGDATLGSGGSMENNDLARATELATLAETVYGFGKSVGLVHLGTDAARTIRTRPEILEAVRDRLDRALALATQTRRHDQWERRVQSRTFVELEQLKRSGKDQEPKGPIFKDLEEVFWVVQGLSFFRMSDDPGRNIQALASRARSALAVLEEAPGKTSDLKAFFRGMNDLLVALRLQLKRTAQPAAALSPSNMQKIVEWAQTHVHKSYSFDGLALSRRDGGNGEPIEYRLPMAIGSPDETFIDRFQEAMLAQSLLEPRAQPV